MLGKVIIAGGTGMLGRSLRAWLVRRGYQVVVLGRREKYKFKEKVAGSSTLRYWAWDGRTAGRWADELEGAAAVINLAGRSVNCRYNATNRRQIMDSRVQSTQALAKAI